MDLLKHGERKFPEARMIASSGGLGWQGIAAELRSHPAGDLPAIQPEQIEITLAVAGERDALVSRKGAGLRQQTPVVPGAIWICPTGVSEDDIRITRTLSRILHIYLPSPVVTSASDEAPVLHAGQELRYLAGLQDGLIRQIGLSLIEEMTTPTAGGQVLADALGLALSARLAQAYATGTPLRQPSVTHRSRLDEVRTARVIEYMRAHLDEDLGLADLAAVACLSPFHFSRMFRLRTGVPPHRFLATLRLEAAKLRLRHGRETILEIALACRFSNQANFARAFRQATGMTPGDYRRGASA